MNMRARLAKFLWESYGSLHVEDSSGKSIGGYCSFARVSPSPACAFDARRSAFDARRSALCFAGGEIWTALANIQSLIARPSLERTRIAHEMKDTLCHFVLLEVTMLSDMSRSDGCAAAQTRVLHVHMRIRAAF